MCLDTSRYMYLKIQIRYNLSEYIVSKWIRMYPKYMTNLPRLPPISLSTLLS